MSWRLNIRLSSFRGIVCNLYELYKLEVGFQLLSGGQETEILGVVQCTLTPSVVQATGCQLGLHVYHDTYVMIIIKKMNFVLSISQDNSESL